MTYLPSSLTSAPPVMPLIPGQTVAPVAAPSYSETHSTPSVSGSLYTKALVSPQIRFGHQLTKSDYVVSQGAFVPMTADTSAKTLMALMQNALMKLGQGDLSNIKYAPHSYESSYPNDAKATADNLILLGRPVDTVIESIAGPAALYSILMSRVISDQSRAYIAKDATITLGPHEFGAGGKNHDQQIRREFFNEHFRDLESLVSIATGKTDRVAISKDLNSAKELNALEALAYGEKGLADAILMGSDKVLSREKLLEFYQSKGWDPKTDRSQIDSFNQEPDSLEEIPAEFLTPLIEYNKHSVPSELQLKRNTRRNYHSIGDGIEDFAVVKRRLGGDPRQISEAYIDKPTLRDRINGTPDLTSRIELLTGKPLFSFPGVIYDDTILFHSAFTDFSVDQVQRAIEALDEKKQRQVDANGNGPSNIKILLNSPGGAGFALEELRSTIHQQNTPVDVIVQGMAASAGAYLLASATGNRFATPSAGIMFHQSLGYSSGNFQQQNEQLDNTQALNKKLAGVLANSTGRDIKDIWRDMKQDTWMNGLEALFYGPKGLLDGILVGPNNAITKEDVLEYLKTDSEVQGFLKEKYGKDNPDENVQEYLDDRLHKLREPNRIHDPEEWEKVYGADPFENSLKTIMAVAEKSKPLDEIEKLKGSAPRSQPTIDQFVVGIDDPRMEMLLPFLNAEGKLTKSDYALGA